MPDTDYAILVIDRLSDRGVEGKKLSFEPNFDPSRLLYRFSVPLLPRPKYTGAEEIHEHPVDRDAQAVQVLPHLWKGRLGLRPKSKDGPFFPLFAEPMRAKLAATLSSGDLNYEIKFNAW